MQTKVFSTRELIDYIYKGESIPQDSRFMPEERGGVFHYFDPSEIIEHSNMPEKFYPYIEVDTEIVGLAELQKNPHEENTYWVKFVSVDPKYQGKGYASRLAEKIFEFAKERNITLEGSSYSDDGWLKLKQVFNKLAQETNVRWIDKETRV